MSEFLEWLKAAGIRALRTFAQGALGFGIVEGLRLSEVDWVGALSAGAVSAIISFLMSLAGLPEVPQKKIENPIEHPPEDEEE